MNKFSLEVENWTEYELVKDFSSFDRAKRYGLERFAQNNFRVFDRSAGAVVYEHDPFEVIQREASGELNRFRQNEKWRRIFAERRADEIRAGQERERLAERAARLRAQQAELDRQRRQRLQGFSFVGGEPDIMSDAWWDAQVKRSNPVVEKVNWIKEGF